MWKSFGIGDKVVYRNHGVCEIKAIKKENFGNGMVEYFIINPIYHDSDLIIRIPTNQTQVFKKLPTKKEAHNLILMLKNNESIWIDNVKNRKDHFNRLLSRGDEKDIASIIYSIRKRSDELTPLKKQISMTDRIIYDRCKKLLYEELAHALKLDYNKVDEYIDKYLRRT